MLKRKPKKQTVLTASISAPIGGLNARDAIADMPDTDALMLDNFFCKPSTVDVRNGSESWVTGIGSWVETLMSYNGTSARKLFGIATTSVYDCTSSGAVGAAVKTGLTNARFQHINIGTSGGHYLMAVNGADKLIGYDGSAWWQDGDGAHDITGVNTNTIIAMTVWKNRIWMIPSASTKAWYLPTQAIAGAATSIDLSTIFKLGGYIMAITPWTIDSYAGVDDYLAFITSEGEVAIYKGTDPAAAATFMLQGVFRIGRPIGRRCCLKLGSDIVVLCADGVVLLSKALLTDRTAQQEAITDKITNLISGDVSSYGSNYGWQLVLHPIGTKMLINIPQVESSIAYQYVMNTNSKAWSRFTNWNAACWETMGDSLFYGGNGVVVHADTGSSDLNANIQADVKQAFSYFGRHGQQKRFTMARPILSSSGTITAAIAMNVDYDDRDPTSTPAYSGSAGSPWDTSPWDTSPWGQSDVIQKHWQTVNGVGYCGAFRMTILTKNFNVSWQSTDYMYEPGGIL